MVVDFRLNSLVMQSCKQCVAFVQAQARHFNLVYHAMALVLNTNSQRKPLPYQKVWILVLTLECQRRVTSLSEESQVIFSLRSV